MRKFLKWTFIVFGTVFVIALFIFVTSVQFKNVDENNLPKLIQANVVNPNLVVSVSKFRSGAGHSNPGWPEACRSMKHYITVYDGTKQVQQNFDRSTSPSPEFAVPIYSPVTGHLSKSGTGEGDDQLNIGVDGYRGFSIRLEHVHLLPGVGSLNAKVSAGQEIATVWNNQNFDLSVFYSYFRGTELFSYFEVLPDNLFTAWQTQGATNPNEFVFTKAYRDANPLRCANNRPGTPDFLDANGQITENWNPENFVEFKPYYNQDTQQDPKKIVN